jgi:N-acetylmuramic acid 6-phosphate etherase
VTMDNTERPSPRYSDIDVWEPSDIAEAMIEGQFTAVAAVRAARPAIVGAALAAEARLRTGGRLVYVGAGTSGRLAVQDGAELIPTFSWPQDRLLLLMAGGKDALLRSVEGAEDAVDQAIRLVQRHEIGVNDVLIGVAASGTTPFTLSCLKEARRRGALTIGVANNRVYDGLMVDLQAVNQKLVRRSESILKRLTGRSSEQACEALRQANGNVKLAVLLLHGCDLKEATSVLDRAGGQLRAALAAIGKSGPDPTDLKDLTHAEAPEM